MKISELCEILKARVLVGEDQMNDIIISGGAADLMDDILAAAAKGCALLTGVVTEHVIQTAKIVQVGAVVIVRGKKPPANMIELARSYEIPLLVTDYSLFVACGRLYMNGIRGLDGSW
jgi:predicted transcriptional regulator